MSDIIIVAASNNKNLELANEFKKELDKLQTKNEILDLIQLGLPMYTPDEEAKGVPQKVHDIVKQFEAAKGFVFVTPEYNGSIPPVLNNLIAWISRSGDEDWRKSFNAKPVALGTFSGAGGVQALMFLRGQLAYIGADVIGRQVRATYQIELNRDDLEGVSALLAKSIK